MEELLEVDRIVHNFDASAGHETQAKKTAFITTCNKDKEKLKKTVLQGAKPKLPDQIQIVGCDITTSRKKQCKSADKRCTKATSGAERIQHAPLGNKRRRVAVEGKTIPTAVYGMNSAQPTLNAARNSVLPY